MSQRKISRAVIKRLPRYYRYLGDLLDMGVERISSGELSQQMRVTASQIRQDLNNFGGDSRATATMSAISGRKSLRFSA